MTSQEDRQAAAERFYGPFAGYEQEPRRVGWESDVAHRIRLRAAMTEMGQMDSIHSVLDAGCGEGALARALVDAGYEGAYLGEDIQPAMIERARRSCGALPLARMDLQVADSYGPGAAADVVVCSGALNTPVGPDHSVEWQAALTGLWARTRHVLLIDFAVEDRHHGVKRGVIAGVPLELAWRVARKLSRAVVVREDVMPGEALLSLRRNTSDRLERLAPDPKDQLDRAEILLNSGQTEAARSLLCGSRDPRARLLVASANAMSGRVRDAANELEALGAGETPDAVKARIHLALLRRATRRVDEAISLLEAVARSGGELADEARLHLAETLAQRGAPRSEIQGWVDPICDPWFRREGLGLLARLD